MIKTMHSLVWNLKLGITLAVVASLAAVVLAKPPGGKGNGGGEDPPPSWNLPPFAYMVETVLIEGMGRHHDTNDYGVSAISVRVPYVSEWIDTENPENAAALVYPDNTVVYLDNLIDPTLPYDLEAAIDINNAGQVFVIGWVAGSDDSRALLLTPNVNAETDGFAYVTELLPMPEGVYSVHFSGMQLNEAGDVLYWAYHADNVTLQFLRYSDGAIESLGEATSEFEAHELNSQGTLRVGVWDYSTSTPQDYLLKVTGAEIFPENLAGLAESQISDLAENGYSCGWQRQLTGYRKVKGQQVPQYRRAPTFYDPDGNATYAAFRSEFFEFYTGGEQINNQLVSGQPVLAGVDNSKPNFWLSYPGYDAAYVTELMDTVNQAAFQDLFYWLNPAETDFTMTTPQSLTGIDHAGAPSFYAGLERVVYPNGQTGSAGLYRIIPVPVAE